MKKFLLTCIAVACSLVAVAEELLIEAESFSQRGGWVLDQQFMDQMGSPYLMAHGMGIPVADATAEINIPENTLNVDVSEEVLAERRAKWQPREPKVTTGYLARYAALVTDSSKGAILQAPTV